MRTVLAGLMALFLGGFATPSFADHHECSCDKECAEKCAKGEGLKGPKKCKCKTCDCAKTGKCSHDKCKHHDHGAEAEKAK